MNRRFPRSSGDNIEPAVLVILDRNGQLQSGTMHFFNKTRNEIQLTAPNTVSQFAIIEYAKATDAWYGQEVVIIKSALHPRPGTERIELKEKTITKLNGRPDAIRFVFFRLQLPAITGTDELLPPPPVLEATTSHIAKRPCRSVYSMPRDLLQEAFNKFEEETNCIICAEAFKEPIILGCGHTFCTGCMGEWKKSYMAQRNIRNSKAHSVCPICKAPAKIQVPNRAVNNIIEAVAPLKSAVLGPALINFNPQPTEVITLESDNSDNDMIEIDSDDDDDDAVICLDDISPVA